MRKQLGWALVFILSGSLLSFVIFAKIEVVKLTHRVNYLQTDNTKLMRQLDSVKKLPCIVVVMLNDSVFRVPDGDDAKDSLQIPHY